MRARAPRARALINRAARIGLSDHDSPSRSCPRGPLEVPFCLTGTNFRESSELVKLLRLTMHEAEGMFRAGQAHRPETASNSPLQAPSRKAFHSEAVNRSTFPWGSLLSRTPTCPPLSPATSTQLPLAKLSELLVHTGPGVQSLPSTASFTSMPPACVLSVRPLPFSCYNTAQSRFRCQLMPFNIRSAATMSGRRKAAGQRQPYPSIDASVAHLCPLVIRESDSFFRMPSCATD
jgi:hypothetical protein